MGWRTCLIIHLLLTGSATATYKLDLDSTDSMADIAKSMVKDMMSFYGGNHLGGTPGLLPKPYYWWEGGALMGSLIDYWYYTGDTQWNDIAQDGLLFQTGPNNDYMPPNQTVTEGNDDQGFWGMAVLSAAETNFQNPPDDKPQWLALAQAVFNTQAARWETRDCGGGLRWQIFTWNNGYNYKNSISQACFFNIAARLARYTGNQSYAHWAEKTWDWMVATKLLDTRTFYIYDGMHIENCSRITPYQWTYNAGAFLLGAAAMYNASTTASQAETWRERVDGLLNGSLLFFTGATKDIMTEVACEPVDLCDLDQQSFKAYLARWMAATTKWAPWTYGRVKPLLEASAVAATSTCTGGDNDRMCGLKWNTRKWDGTTGVGQQMAAMEVILANMIARAPPPVTNWDGGTSVGDPAAGGGGGGGDGANVGRKGRAFHAVSGAERAGAYILTILTILGLTAGTVFVLLDENDHSSPAERLARSRAALVGACSSWDFGLRRLPRQNLSQEEEKGPQRPNSTEAGHPQPNNPASPTGMVVHSCVRTAGPIQVPIQRAYPGRRRVRTTWSDPAMVTVPGAARRGERADKTEGSRQQQTQPSSPSSPSDEILQGITTVQRAGAGDISGVHRLETRWEEA